MLSSKAAPIVLLSCVPWAPLLISTLSTRLDCEIIHISSPHQLNHNYIGSLKPQFIFATHWRYLIPPEIFSNHRVVIFHMTDLPYGRGGSPLQNLILRGHESTVLSAIQCVKELDSGDIYLQKNLSLHGTAEEIYIRADKLIVDMIVELLCVPNSPYPQYGPALYFSRRKPADSNLKLCTAGSSSQWYDFIRMLDAEGYPHAFLDVHGMRLEFRRVTLRNDGLQADVTIRPSKSTSFTA